MFRLQVEQKELGIAPDTKSLISHFAKDEGGVGQRACVEMSIVTNPR